MKFSQVVSAAAMAALVNAHARVFRISVNDVSQGNSVEPGGYIRAPPNSSPLKDLTSNDFRCNVGGGSAEPKTVSVAAGSKITVQWFHEQDSSSDDIIDKSHKGPILVYIAPTSSNGAGNVWVKLAHEGYSNGKWAVENLISNRGQHSFTIPAALADGDYLIRPELIAHHESDVTYISNPARGAQFYMSCIQIKVTSGGNTQLPSGVAIPGVYTYTDPGILFNLYSSFTSYQIPGPAVWNPANSVAAAAASTTLLTTVRPAASTTSNAPIAVTTTNAAFTTSKATVTTSKAAVTTTRPVVSCSKGAGQVPTTKLSTAVQPAPTGQAVEKYGRCGGRGFTGSRVCVAGTTCQTKNPWYSQCL